jgi:hypothetical protein
VQSLHEEAVVRHRASWLALSVVIALAGCTSPGSGSKSGADRGKTATKSEAPAAVAAPPLPFEQVRDLVKAYRSAHTGNGGKDRDINAKTAKQVAADPDAQKLLSICGKDQRPVIPLLAWEYGGNDHEWIHPERSALVYCVYTPVKKSTSDWSEHWKYDTRRNHITADMYLPFPDQNPCRNRQGGEQVEACIGDSTNYEILVDTISLHDGHDVKLDLADSSTALWLILPDRTRALLANFD